MNRLGEYLMLRGAYGVMGVNAMYLLNQAQLSCMVG